MAPAAVTNGASDKVNGQIFTKPHRKIFQTTIPNPSLQVTADHKLKQVDAPVYQPGPKEVLIHIKTVGICG